MDLTNSTPVPVMVELLKIQAHLKTLVSVSLNEEQKREYEKRYSKNLEAVIKDYINMFPDTKDYIDKLPDTFQEGYL